jgi:transcriptional regulator with XRE-family HTH domain
VNDFKLTLRAARINCGITQAEAAKNVGVSRQTLNSWENGHTQANDFQFNLLSEMYGIPQDLIVVPKKTDTTRTKKIR